MNLDHRLKKELSGNPRRRSSLDYQNLQSIVLIANKYDVEPKHLVDALCYASENTRSQCGGLNISCRDINNGFATFLITFGDSVVWQFPVQLNSIQNQDAKDYITKVIIPRESDDLSQKDLKIGELTFGMKGINVKGTIVEIPPARRVLTKWGKEVYVSNVTLADENAAIRLSLWDNQIDAVHVGDEVELENCSVKRFAGELQLRLGRKTTLKIIAPSQQGGAIRIPTSKIEN